MTRRAFVTVITRNYTHFALALMESVGKHHPEADQFVCLADSLPETHQLDSGRLQLLHASDLQIPSWRRFAFQYTPFELSCALKPFAMRALMEQGYDQVIYLDSDMRVFGPLSDIVAELLNASIVLTPHLIRPFPEDGFTPGEDLFLYAGAFNAGFVAISHDETSRRFISWWSNRLLTQGYKDLAGSIFVDQKWLGLVPGLFEKVCILRNPGYNTGHWTLPQFEMSIDANGQCCIGGQPIRLFHFSSFNPKTPNEFLNCQNRFAPDDLPGLNSLIEDYYEALSRHNEPRYDELGCQFDTLLDGTTIHPGWREAIRRQHAFLDGVTDPFAVQEGTAERNAFISLQAKARKWRKDWRLKGFSSGKPKSSRKLKAKFKAFLTQVGLRKKKAA